MSDLIEQHSNYWKKALIKHTFNQVNVERILCIPLPIDQQANRLVWRGKASGDYTVRSGYKILLQNVYITNLQTEHNLYRSMFKKLWFLELP